MSQDSSVIPLEGEKRVHFDDLNDERHVPGAHDGELKSCLRSHPPSESPPSPTPSEYPPSPEYPPPPTSENEYQTSTQLSDLPQSTSFLPRSADTGGDPYDYDKRGSRSSSDSSSDNGDFNDTDGKPGATTNNSWWNSLRNSWKTFSSKKKPPPNSIPDGDQTRKAWTRTPLQTCDTTRALESHPASSFPRIKLSSQTVDGIQVADTAAGFLVSIPLPLGWAGFTLQVDRDPQTNRTTLGFAFTMKKQDSVNPTTPTDGTSLAPALTIPVPGTHTDGNQTPTVWTERRPSIASAFTSIPVPVPGAHTGPTAQTAQTAQTSLWGSRPNEETDGGTSLAPADTILPVPGAHTDGNQTPTVWTERRPSIASAFTSIPVPVPGAHTDGNQTDHGGW